MLGRSVIGYSLPGSSVHGILGFSRQGYWGGLPCPPPGELPDPGIKPMSPAFQADSFTTEPPGKPLSYTCMHSFSYSFHYGLSQDLYHRLPELHRRTFLFIPSMYNRMHLLIPNTWSIPASSYSLLGICKSALYVCASLSVLKVSSFVSCFRFHIQAVSCGVCLSLTDGLHFVWSSLGPSLLLQVAFFLFLWLRSIPLYVCTMSLSVPLLMNI